MRPDPHEGTPKLNNLWLSAAKTPWLSCQLRKDETVSVLGSVKQTRPQRSHQFNHKSQKLRVLSRSNIYIIA